MKQRYLEDLNYFLNCANQKRGKKLDKKFPNETIHLDFYFLHSKEELNDFIKSNTIYNIIRYIDLEGKTLTVPDNSVLNFIGGTIGNGTIIGNKTKVINLNVDRIVLSGTWFDSGITSNRPTNVLVGFQYFDSTLSKPIYYKGNNEWVDATGATV